jgi:protein-L-isoaspartate(D-aspartate) O-methyltransferase
MTVADGGPAGTHRAPRSEEGTVDDPSVHAERRREMVDAVRRQGVRDERVLAALAEVPRERFVPEELAAQAHELRPLPIGEGQTISEPSVVAIMTEALGLTGAERVLEIGTGSGYAAAVLGRCAHEVVTVEVHRSLADRAAAVLDGLGYDHVEVRVGDGVRGAPDRAPFDAISVTAMAQDELPPALVDQLAPDGVLVCPVGQDRSGQLVRLRHGRREELLPVGFVPLVGGAD